MYVPYIHLFAAILKPLLYLFIVLTILFVEPASAQSAIQIDATALSAGAFNLNFGSAGGGSTDQIISLPLLPGNYSFHAPASNATAQFDFIVTSSGTVDFDPGLDGYVSGRDTSTLTVSGFPITIDATALSASGFNLNFGTAGGGAMNTVTTLQLLPGNYSFHAPASNATAQFDFIVTSSGTVDFDPGLDGYVSGRGTSTLTISGFPITINATALSASGFNLNFGAAGGGATNEVTTLHLLPGAYSFHAPASNATAQFDFTVTSSGTVDFDPGLDGYVSGRGTNMLTISGFPITINATALSATTFNLDFGSAGGGSTSQVTTLRLLPGGYSFHAPASSAVVFTFIVTSIGTVDYDASFDGLVSGRGTNTLVVGTPEQRIESVAEKIQSLVNTGVLNQRLSDALITKLEAAIKKLDEGNLNRAINQLQAFINQVNAFIRAGRLPPLEGQSLIEAVNEIITMISES